MEDDLHESWIMRAACAEPTRDPELWFPETAEKRLIQEAKRICFDECPVRLEYLQQACHMRETSGIFAGIDAKKRNEHDYNYDTLKRVGKR